jgi:hypothetical protein
MRKYQANFSSKAVYALKTLLVTKCTLNIDQNHRRIILPAFLFHMRNDFSARPSRALSPRGRRRLRRVLLMRFNQKGVCRHLGRISIFHPAASKRTVCAQKQKGFFTLDILMTTITTTKKYLVVSFLFSLKSSFSNVGFA